MAALIGDASQFTTFNFTVAPQNITGNTTGGNVATSPIGGGILTLFFATGAVNTLTSAICYPEVSADGITWVTPTGVGGTTPNITLTAANSTGSVAFFPGNGSVSQYVRGNVVLTGTSANVTAMVFAQNRIDTSAGFTNTPPSGAT